MVVLACHCMPHVMKCVAEGGVKHAPARCMLLFAGLHKGQQTASPKPVFARLEGDYVTAQPDAALAGTAVVKA